jgi:uncharacterized membrane protein YbhN (UPF0104 family)
MSATRDVEGAGLRRQLLMFAVVILTVAAVLTLAPGLTSVRARFTHADASWLWVGVALKVLSGISYVLVFRVVFDRRMSAKLSSEIGFSELGANAVLPTGGAGGLAVGAWALHRRGMDRARIARRSVAFFLITSAPNVLGVILLGLGLGFGVFAGRVGPTLSLAPAAIATVAIIATVAGGRWAGGAHHRALGRRGAVARLAPALGALSLGVRDSLVLLRRPAPTLIAGLAGYLLFDIAILWATFRAFGAAPSIPILCMAYLIGELGGLIPVPGGVGGVDLGLVGALAIYGVPIGQATAAVLAYRAIALIVPAMLGVLAFVQLRRSLARLTLDPSGSDLDEALEVSAGRVVSLG